MTRIGAQRYGMCRRYAVPDCTSSIQPDWLAATANEELVDAVSADDIELGLEKVEVISGKSVCNEADGVVGRVQTPSPQSERFDESFTHRMKPNPRC